VKIQRLRILPKSFILTEGPSKSSKCSTCGRSFVESGTQDRRPSVSTKSRSARATQTLLTVSKRLNTAYILKEEFGQLCDYQSEAWARRFFDNWKASLKWRRLKPYEKFATVVERHWDGIAAFCKPENKVALGFVESLNNKIRVIQRLSYGLRDEEYLRLKILTSMLPDI
jgi:transposase